MDTNDPQNKFCNRKNLLILFSKIYFCSLIYAIFLAKNNKWTKVNYILALIIYSVIIIFCIIVWFTFINLNIYDRIARRNQNTSIDIIPWYQMIDINQISRSIISNFVIIESIEESPTDLNENSETIETKTCLICNEEYLRNDENNIKYIKLNCNHDFCEKCISIWCSINNSCPLCRSEILSESEIIFRTEIEV